MKIGQMVKLENNEKKMRKSDLSLNSILEKFWKVEDQSPRFNVKSRF